MIEVYEVSNDLILKGDNVWAVVDWNVWDTDWLVGFFTVTHGELDHETHTVTFYGVFTLLNSERDDEVKFKGALQYLLERAEFEEIAREVEEDGVIDYAWKEVSWTPDLFWATECDKVPDEIKWYFECEGDENGEN